jgi:hypothetical protein
VFRASPDGGQFREADRLELDRPPEDAILGALIFRGEGDPTLFIDRNRETAGEVAKALNVDAKPKSLAVSLSEEADAEFAEKELRHRTGVKVTDIRETVFAIAMRDGKPVVRVVSQVYQ